MVNQWLRFMIHDGTIGPVIYIGSHATKLGSGEDLSFSNSGVRPNHPCG